MAALAAFQGSARADVYTAGNLVVYRVGDGTTALTSAAAAVFLDQYSVTGGPAISSQSLTTTTASTSLTASGSATSEGAISLSGNGQYLVVPGYAGVVGTTGIASSAGTREIGVIDSDGGARLQSIGTFGGTNNIRGAASPDGSTLYASTAGAGIGTITLGGTGNATVVGGAAASTNTRAVSVFNGQLYTSTGAGTRGLYTVNASSEPSLVLTGATSSPYGFALSPDGNTLYVADDRTVVNGGGIQKYTLSGSTFTLSYTIPTGTGSTVGARGLTVDFSTATPTIYATTAETTADRLIQILDTSTTTGADDLVTTLATASSNEVFRGVAFAPTAAPEPTSMVLVGLGLIPLTMGRRRRQPTAQA